MRIAVRELIGFDDAITADDGQRIYDLIHPVIAAGTPVVVDFDGMEAAASPFFNAAFGQLLRDIEPDALSRLLRVENIRPVADQTLRLVLQNAHRYYHDPKYQKALDEVLETMSEAT